MPNTEPERRPVYNDGFVNWADVQQAFDMDEPEPDEVICAEYDLSQPYEGSACVAYRRGEKFYLVEGGHCSCYGLEGQWEPEEFDRFTFREYVARSGYLDIVVP